jgi:hypothetical protein
LICDLPVSSRAVGHSEVIPSAPRKLAVRISQLLDCAREGVCSETRNFSRM